MGTLPHGGPGILSFKPAERIQEQPSCPRQRSLLKDMCLFDLTECFSGSAWCDIAALLGVIAGQSGL